MPSSCVPSRVGPLTLAGLAMPTVPQEPLEVDASVHLTLGAAGPGGLDGIGGSPGPLPLEACE